MGENNEEKEKLFLVMGDVSGIQEFIYTVAQAKSDVEGAKGVSKRLRGRSFYVQALTKACANYFVSTTGGTEIFCTGGVFQLLIPETAIEKLEIIREEINSYLLKRFHGRLGIVIAWSNKALTKDELKNSQIWRKVLTGLQDKINLAKKRKFVEALSAFNFPNIFQMKREKSLAECPSCHQQTVIKEPDQEVEVCNICKKHHEIGKEVAEWSAEKRKSICIDFGQEFGELKIADDNYKSTIPIVVDKEQAAILKTLLKDDKKEQQHLKEYDTVPFEILAKLSIGDNRLGVLKMDVDNLGLIISEGNQKATYRDIQKLSTALDRFFTVRLNEICKDQFSEWQNKINSTELEKYKDSLTNIFYTVYAGGDDTLIIGPWSEIPHLAVAIRHAFISFAENELQPLLPDWYDADQKVTISAGIFFCKPKFPINRFAKLADGELEKSKDEGRDRITIFGETVGWDDFYGQGFQYLEFGEELYKMMQNPDETLSSGFVYQLIALKKKYFPNKHQQGDWNIIPQLVYQLARTVNIEKFRNNLKAKLITNKQGMELMRNINISASYALLKNRKG